MFDLLKYFRFSSPESINEDLEYLHHNVVFPLMVNATKGNIKKDDAITLPVIPSNASATNIKLYFKGNWPFVLHNMLYHGAPVQEDFLSLSEQYGRLLKALDNDYVRWLGKCAEQNISSTEAMEVVPVEEQAMLLIAWPNYESLATNHTAKISACLCDNAFYIPYFQWQDTLK